MKQSFALTHTLLLLFVLLVSASLSAQTQNDIPLVGQTDIKHYTIYAEGNHRALSDSTNFGVSIRDGGNVNGGAVGSNFFVTLGRSITVNGQVYTGNRMFIGFGNTINGNLVARNDAKVDWNSIYAGDQNQIGITTPSPNGGLMHSRGNIFVEKGSTVRGPVRTEDPYTYNGPEPTIVSGGGSFPSLDMPIMPTMPAPLKFPAAGSTNITATTTLKPGAYGSMILRGGATVTLSQPGTYIFQSITAVGLNNLNFTIPLNSNDGYRIYVHGDVDLGAMQVKINDTLPSGNSFPMASRIYLETHGTGSSNQNAAAFYLNDMQGVQTNWAGTVYAPNGRIKIAPANPLTAPNPVAVHGALWSISQVLIGVSAFINHEALAIFTTDSTIQPYYTPPPGGKVNAENNKIGAELFSLKETYDPALLIEADNDIFQIDGDKVWIEVIAIQGNVETLRATLQAKGMTNFVSNGAGSLVITGLFPIDRLLELNSLTEVDYARPLFEPLTKAGAVMTEGAKTMKADLVAAGFPSIRGGDVKIGVLSDSYDKSSATIQYAPEDVLAGELPNDVQVVLENFIGLKSDEGRAMLQIVHDIAPDAKLAFRTGFISAGDFATGIRQLASSSLSGGKCHIIVDDISYITEPYYKDGVISKAVDEVVAGGTTYVTSAGNFGSRSFESTYMPTSSITGIIGEPHNFGTSAYQRLNLKAGTYTIVLQWDDNFYSLGGAGNTGAALDMDIYLVDMAGNLLFGFNRNNIGADPYEVLPFVVNTDTEAQLVIAKAGGIAPAGLRFKYIIFRGAAEIVGYSGSSTIVGQANAKGAITVGAILYDNPITNIPGYPIETLPAGYTHPTVASFSSRGGNIITGEATHRNKPDIISPNGVETTVRLGIYDFDGDNRYNFFGTSASAPHIAAVAGLLIEAKKKFSNVDITPPDIRTLINSTATSLTGSTSHNTTSGFGLVNADAAMRTFANPTPTLTSLHTIDPATPGVVQPVPNPVSGSFSIVAKGSNISNNTVIYFNDVAVSTTRIGDDLVSATVSTSSPNTDRVKLYTPPISSSGLDGGYSNELIGLYNKPLVEVKVNNATRKYGERNPEFSVTVTLDGTPVTDAAQLTLLNLNLTQSQYSTTATATSPAYVYPVTVLTFTPNADYRYNIVPGSLTVKRLPLKITPKNKSITYGEYLQDINYDYVFTSGNLYDPAGLQTSVSAEHKKSIATYALAVLHGFTTASPALSDADLLNKSVMASYQSLINARRFLLNNTDLTAMPLNPTPAQIELQRLLIDVSAQSLNNYKTNPNNLVLANVLDDGTQRGLVNSKSVAEWQVTTIFNGQLQTISNGLSFTLSNGQLQTISNGGGTYVLINGELHAVGVIEVYANGEVYAFFNGQLQTISNGQLMTISNGGQVMILSNGQLQTISNGEPLSIPNGQLQTISNGELFIVVNGEIQVVEYVEVSESGDVKVFYNGQLQTISNGQLMTISNGLLIIITNGQLQTISNGQLMTISNGEELLALANGQLQTISNELEASTAGSNTEALVIVDRDDLAIQNGAFGFVSPVNLITGLDPGIQKLVPATFFNDNYEISYGLGTVNIHPVPTVTLTATDPAPLNGSVKIDANYNSDALNLKWIYSIPEDSVSQIIPSGSDIPTSISVTNTTPAVYPVHLTYENTAGRQFKTPTVYAVFYDPTSGFVTGAGWINSPVVAAINYMQVAGKAHFGFVSKYEKGKTVPSGNTQFQFQAGGLNFKSSIYEWLVVSGSRAQFKGKGTVNGTGDYGFLLTAVDGNLSPTPSPDRFRIKIWDRTNNAIVYDNQNGTADDAALNDDTKIGSGSIVIHTGKTKSEAAPSQELNIQQELQATGKLAVTAMPNPTNNHFKLVLQSGSTNPVSLQVLDVMGRIVEKRNNIAANGTLTIGDHYQAGVYIVELQQGTDRVIIRLVKTLK